METNNEMSITKSVIESLQMDLDDVTKKLNEANSIREEN